jgi:hypothetical protein
MIVEETKQVLTDAEYLAGRWPENFRREMNSSFCRELTTISHELGFQDKLEAFIHYSRVLVSDIGLHQWTTEVAFIFAGERGQDAMLDWLDDTPMDWIDQDQDLLDDVASAAREEIGYDSTEWTTCRIFMFPILDLMADGSHDRSHGRCHGRCNPIAAKEIHSV